MLNITQFQCVICKYLLLFSVLCDHKQNICCSGKTRLPKTSLRKRHWVFFIFVYRLCRSKTNCYTALSQIILVVFKVGKEPEPTHKKNTITQRNDSTVPLEAGMTIFILKNDFFSNVARLA